MFALRPRRSTGDLIDHRARIDAEQIVHQRAPSDRRSDRTTAAPMRPSRPGTRQRPRRCRGRSDRRGRRRPRPSWPRPSPCPAGAARAERVKCRRGGSDGCALLQKVSAVTLEHRSRSHLSLDRSEWRDKPSHVGRFLSIRRDSNQAESASTTDVAICRSLTVQYVRSRRSFSSGVTRPEAVLLVEADCPGGVRPGADQDRAIGLSVEGLERGSRRCASPLRGGPDVCMADQGHVLDVLDAHHAGQHVVLLVAPEVDPAPISSRSSSRGM